MEKVKMVGYWSGNGESEDYPNPQLLVRKNWDPEEKKEIVKYLRKGVFFRGFWDDAPCRFIENPPREDMGSKEYTDGMYVWPEGLSIYVDEYDVDLPSSFLKHIMNNRYIIPEIIDPEDLRVDLDFWKNWSREFPHGENKNF